MSARGKSWQSPAQLAIRRDFQRPSADEIAPFLTVPTGWVVRDIEGINQVGIPTFAQGLSPNLPCKDGPGEIGGTIALDDILKSDRVRIID